MDHRNRALLIDVPERRAVAQAHGDLEFRENGPDGQYLLEGYAATWDAYDCYGGPEAGGWVEQLDRRSMDRTLASSPDVMLLVNHEGLPLARTKSGTLTLRADSHGLYMRAPLDPSDPDVKQIAPKMIRKDLDEMSFAFRVKDQVWDRDYTSRQIMELSLQKGDVSVVNYGMNPNTHASMMVGALAALSDRELCEVRKLDRNVIARASRTLERAWRGDEPLPDDQDPARAVVNSDGSHLIYEGQCVTCQGARNRGIDTAEYADTGYIDDVKRYPIDDIHVKSSWDAIRQPRNQRAYTPEQLATVTSRIKAAMEKAGHDVNEAKSQDQAVSDISHVEAVRKFGGGVALVAVMSDGTRTPLPNYRQSGELVGPAAGDGGNPYGTGVYSLAQIREMERADKPKPDDDKKPDDTAPDGKDPAEPDDDDKKPKRDDKKPADDMDDEDDPSQRVKDPEDPDLYDDTDEQQDSRSVDDQLRDLRKEAELPDLPTVTQALEYLRQMA